MNFGLAGCVVKSQSVLSVSHHYSSQWNRIESESARVAHHDTLREICFCDYYCSQMLQCMYQRRVRLCWSKRIADITQCRV